GRGPVRRGAAARGADAPARRRRAPAPARRRGTRRCRGVVVASRRRAAGDHLPERARRMTDLAVIAPDPAFGGGGRALSESLLRAAEEVEREPELHFLRNRRLRAADVRGRSVPQLVPGFDAANVVASAAMIAPRVRNARALFVCTTVASYGYAAVL